MDTKEILALLRGELDLIKRAIANLENMGHKGERGRGRPLGLVPKGNRNETLEPSSNQSDDMDR